MSTISSLTDPTTIAQLDGPPSASTFDPEALARQAPDLHLTVSTDGGGCSARCSVWWTDTPDYAEETVGLVGHYGAESEAAGRAVLDRACRWLADKGCTCAIGPMDGATWYTYRFVTERGDRPPFVLEPWHPSNHPGHFRDAGFAPLARYVSAIGADFDEGHEPSPSDPPRNDVRVRSLDLDRFEAELRRLHDLVTASFADNFLYAPLPEDDFVALYRPHRSLIDPTLVRLLEQEQDNGTRLVGLAFLIPDVVQSKTTSSLPLGAQSETTSSLPLRAQSETTSSLPLGAQAERGASVDAAVLKTLAVHPALTGQGLGRWLTEHIHRRAQEQGYRHVIHALMHEDNVSRNLGYGPPFRRYTLYRRSLA